MDDRTCPSCDGRGCYECAVVHPPAPEPVQATTASGYWDCDCGRECREPGKREDCRAEWVDAPPWTEADKVKLRAMALVLDLRNAERLLTEHGYTITPPAPEASA